MVSTPTSSHILDVPPQLVSSEPHSLSAHTVHDFRHDSPTLAAGNIIQRTLTSSGKSLYDDSSSLLVQVTPAAVVLLDLNLNTLQDSWNPDVSIVAADINATQVCLALTGGSLVLLKTNDGKLDRAR